jgi:hypothetical protein
VLIVLPESFSFQRYWCSGSKFKHRLDRLARELVREAEEEMSPVRELYGRLSGGAP